MSAPIGTGPDPALADSDVAPGSGPRTGEPGPGPARREPARPERPASRAGELHQVAAVPSSTTGPASRGTAAASSGAGTGATAGTADGAGAWSLDHVLLVESRRPGRARRPYDVARLFFTVAAVLLATLLATVVAEAADVLAIDLRDGVLRLPRWVAELVAVLSALAGLAVMIVQLGESALQRQLLRIVEQIGGGLLGVALCLGATAWIDGPGPEQVRTAFEAALPAEVAPIPTYFGFLVGVLSVRGWAERRWLARTAVAAVVGGTLSALVDGTTTLLGAVVAVLLGQCAGLTMRLVAGVPANHPRAAEVATTLAAAGFPPTEVHEIHREVTRGYLVRTATGTLDVLALDRDLEGAGFLSRTWRLLRTRGELVPRHTLTLRADTAQRALLAYAFATAGVRSPQLRACLQVNGDCTVLAYEDVPGQPIAKVAAGDRLQQEIWRQVAAMHRAGLAHRGLSGSAIRVDDAGQPWLVDRSGGEVAAGELAQLTDVAQLLVLLALRSSPRAAVDNAVEILGRERVGRAYPLLQPVVLPRATRRLLRERGEVLSELRSRMIERAQPVDRGVAELERFKPRTVITATSLVVAIYLAGSQLTGVDFLGLARTASPGWVLVALVALAVTFLADPPALLTFVKHKVSYRRAVAVQLAVSFVKLVMPSTLGNAALDYRLLTSSGVPAATATAAAAASQALAVITTVPLLVVLGLASGRAASAGITPSVTAVLVVISLVVALGLLALAPPIRNRARSIWDGFVGNGLTSLLDAMQDPRRLSLALASSVTVTLAFVGCFYACLRALGVDDVSFALLAVIWLTGNTLGTAVPTPGGLGAVEVALTAGLTTAGVAGPLAVSAVLLFRLISFWLPIPFGYLAWTSLQRRGIL